MKQATEYVRGLHYKLRMMGILVDEPAFVFGDNKSVLCNTTMPGSTLKKNRRRTMQLRITTFERVLHVMSGGLRMWIPMRMWLISWRSHWVVQSDGSLFEWCYTICTLRRRSRLSLRRRRLTYVLASHKDGNCLPNFLCEFTPNRWCWWVEVLVFCGLSVFHLRVW